MQEKDSQKKRGRGGPPKPAPEPIQGAPEDVVAFVLKTRTKAERDRLRRGR